MSSRPPLLKVKHTINCASKVAVMMPEKCLSAHDLSSLTYYPLTEKIDLLVGNFPSFNIYFIVLST